MSAFKLYSSLLLIILVCFSFSIAPKPGSVDKLQTDSIKTQNTGTVANPISPMDTISRMQKSIQDNKQGGLQIDTSLNTAPVQTTVQPDTAVGIDSASIKSLSENTLTNTRLFIYIILSVLGLALFFYIFVITLFKTFHKKRSTRQSLLLSWNLFFVISIIWIFIIWGLVAGFWTAASFMIVVIFLFIISLIMTIIAVKSK